LRLLAEALRSAAIGRSGDEAIVAAAEAYRAFVNAHPGLYDLIHRVPLQVDDELAAAALAPVEVAVALLVLDGLNREDALHAVRAIRSAIHGFVTLEATKRFDLPLDLDESLRRLITIIVRGLREPHTRPAKGQQRGPVT
jgi:hypothetical protein